MADKLGDYIVGTAVEAIDTEKLIGEFEKVIVDDVYTNAVPVEKVAENLQQYMNEKGRKINTIAVEDIYVPYAAAERNRMMWGKASKLSDARGSMQPVSDEQQIIEKTSSPTENNHVTSNFLPADKRAPYTSPISSCHKQLWSRIWASMDSITHRYFFKSKINGRERERRNACGPNSANDGRCDILYCPY